MINRHYLPAVLNERQRKKNLPFALLMVIFLVIVLMPTRESYGAISYVQKAGEFSQYNGGGVLPVIYVLNNVSAGNSIIVMFVWGGWGSGANAICSDTQGNSYSTDINLFNASTYMYTTICSSHNVTPLTTSDTITLSFTGSTYGVAATVHEFSGLLSTLPVDNAMASTGGSVTPSSGDVVTTQADELLIGAIGTAGYLAHAFTPGSGYTALAPVGYSGYFSGSIWPEYNIVSTVGTYRADGTLNPSAGWTSAIVTYKAAASTTNITLSGTLYSDEGITPLSGQTVRLLIDGVSAGTSVTDGSGNYSITASVTAGDDYVPLLVYVDNGTVNATTVTVMDPVNYPTTISDLALYADHLIVRDDNQGQTNNIDMNGAKGSVNDADILYSVVGSDLTVTGTNTELYVASGHNYTPGGNVATAHMQIEGTLTGGGNTFTVSGNWEHTNGTFNYNTSTVDFTGTGTISITGAWWTKPFYNVNAAAAGETTTILAGAGIGVANVLSLGSGTLAGGNINLSLNSGTPLVTSGATITNSQIKFHPNNGGPINVAAAAYNNIWLAGNAATNTFNLMGNMSCATLAVYGSGAGDSAVFDTANSAITCNNLVIGSTNPDRYGALQLNNSVVNVSGNVTIYASDTNGTNQIDAGSATINVGGDWFNSDTFTYGTSTVNFTGSGVIDISDAPLRWWDDSKAFFDVSAAAAGQSTDNVRGFVVNNVLTLGTGTVTGGEVVLAKDGGTPLVTSGATLSNYAFKFSPRTSPVNVPSASYPKLWLSSSGPSITFTLMGDISCTSLWLMGNFGKESVLDTANHSITCGFVSVGFDSLPSRYGKFVLNSSTINVDDLTIYASDAGGANQIDAGSATINVNGNWTNNDTFTAGTSTVILGGANQILNGSTTFYNLSKTVTSADILSFAAGSTQGVTGVATLQGVSGQLLSLRSATPGTRWNLNLAAGATKAISYVDVQDSDASGSDSSLIDINPPYSVDSGNNVSWFGNANITVVKSSAVISDPVNGTTNPKRIPGAIIEYSILVTNTAGAQATDLTVTDDLSAETARLSFEVDGYAVGKGIQVTAPNINGGAALNLTNASDGDQGDFGVTAANTVTVGGMVLDAGEQATVRFRVTIQ